METNSFAEMIAADPYQKQAPAFRRIENAFLVFLVLSQVYYWFRYALQVNSNSTSPTYDNTPLAFQVGKYLMALAYCAILVVMIVPMYQRFKIPKTFLLSFGIIGGFFGLLILKYFMADGPGNQSTAIGLIKVAYVAPVVAISIPFLINPRFLKRFKFWAVDMAMVYHVLYSGLQMALYFTTGRLPGLAYEGGSVRFGGGWDDPNGFGMFLTLPFLYLLTSHPRGALQKVLAVVYGMVIVALLGATISYSAIISFMVGFCLCVALTNLRMLLIFVVTVGTLASAVILSPTIQDALRFNYEQKQDSMQSHVDQLVSVANFFDEDLSTVLFGNGGDVVLAENFYQTMLINFGLIFLVVMFSSIAATIICALVKYYRAKRLKDKESERLFLVGFCFLFAFSLGAAFIPFFIVYPVNLYFWIFSLLVWIYPITDHRAKKTRVSSAAAAWSRSKIFPEERQSP
jgi:hypothetical protein